jgi:hypothetical protein
MYRNLLETVKSLFALTHSKDEIIQKCAVRKDKNKSTAFLFCVTFNNAIENPACAIVNYLRYKRLCVIMLTLSKGEGANMY